MPDPTDPQLDDWLTAAPAARARARALVLSVAETRDRLAATLDQLAAGAAVRGRRDAASRLRELSALARQQASRARVPRTRHGHLDGHLRGRLDGSLDGDGAQRGPDPGSR